MTIENSSSPSSRPTQEKNREDIVNQILLLIQTRSAAASTPPKLPSTLRPGYVSSVDYAKPLSNLRLDSNILNLIRGGDGFYKSVASIAPSQILPFTTSYTRFNNQDRLVHSMTRFWNLNFSDYYKKYVTGSAAENGVVITFAKSESMLKYNYDRASGLVSQYYTAFTVSLTVGYYAQAAQGYGAGWELRQLEMFRAFANMFMEGGLQVANAIRFVKSLQPVEDKNSPTAAFVDKRVMYRNRFGAALSAGFSANSLVGVIGYALRGAQLLDSDDITAVRMMLLSTGLSFNTLYNLARLLDGALGTVNKEKSSALMLKFIAARPGIAVFGAVVGVTHALFSSGSLLPLLASTKLSSEEKIMVGLEYGTQLAGGMAEAAINYRMGYLLSRGILGFSKLVVAGSVVSFLATLSPTEIYGMVKQDEYADKVSEIGEKMMAYGYEGDSLFASFLKTKNQGQWGLWAGSVAAMGVGGVATAFAAVGMFSSIAGGLVGIGVAASVIAGLIRGMGQIFVEQEVCNYTEEIVKAGGGFAFFDKNMDASYKEFIESSATQKLLEEIRAGFKVDGVTAVTTVPISPTALAFAAMTRFSAGIHTTKTYIDYYAGTSVMLDKYDQKISLQPESGVAFLGYGDKNKSQAVVFLSPLMAPGEETRVRINKGKNYFVTTLTVENIKKGWDIYDGDTNTTIDLRNIVTRYVPRDKDNKKILNADGSVQVINIGVRLNLGRGNDVVLAGVGSTLIRGDEGNDTVVYSGLENVEISTSLDEQKNIIVHKKIEKPRVYEESVSRTTVPTGDSRTDVVDYRSISLVTTEEVLTANDTLTGVEGIVTGDRNDSVTMDDNDNVIITNRGRDTINAAGGRDTIDSGEDDDADWIDAGAGDDIIVGYQTVGMDTINGGDGTDTVDYSAKTAYTSIGYGMSIDLRSGTARKFRSNVSASIDTLISIENVIGTSNDDYIWGSDSANFIGGGNGRDSIHGGGGDDTISGGGGVDCLWGGDGNDYFIQQLDQDGDSIWGGDGANVIDYTSLPASMELSENLGKGVYVDLGSGKALKINHAKGAKNVSDAQFEISSEYGAIDTFWNIRSVIGSAWSDTLIGSNDDDLFCGVGGDDLIYGLDGRDLLAGGEGKDTIVGGEGSDSIVGGLDSDALYGGAGDDYFFQDMESAGDTIDGGYESDVDDGSDWVLYNQTHQVVGSNNVSGQMIFWGAECPLSVEGNSYDIPFWVWGEGEYQEGQKYTISFSVKQLTEFKPQLMIDGVKRTEQAAIERQGDWVRYSITFVAERSGKLNLGLSAANATSPTGKVEFILKDLGVVMQTGGIDADLSKGTVRKMVAPWRNDYGVTDTLINIENIVGSNLADTIRGDARANILFGDGGNDLIEGGDGADFLKGGEGRDTLLGGGHDDIIQQNIEWQNEEIDGGDGFDFLRYDLTMFSASGRMTILSNGKTVNMGKEGVYIDLTAGYVYKFYSCEKGAYDTIKNIEAALGNMLNDTLIGNEVANELYGISGDDRISGLKGDDTLFGGSGADTLLGGEGNDDILGGIGSDSLSGDAGDDYFYQDMGWGDSDTIDGGEGSNNWVSYAITKQESSELIHDSFDQSVFKTEYVKNTAALSGQGSEVVLDSSNFGASPTGGRYLVVRSAGPNELTKSFWGSSPISLVEGQRYTLSLWINSSVDTQLQLMFNTNDIEGAKLSIVGSGKWQKYTLTFTATTSVGAGSLFLRSNHPYSDKNKEALVDFAVDDITLSMKTGGIRANLDQGQVIKFFKETDAQKYSVDSLKNIQNIQGTSEDDDITGNNKNVADAVVDNQLEGREGNDTLHGLDGKDVLRGDEGDDFLDGGNDNDWLFGGQGHDTLLGGKGDDVFYQLTSEMGDSIDGGDDSDSDYLSYMSSSFSDKEIEKRGGWGVEINLLLGKIYEAATDTQGVHNVAFKGVDTVSHIKQVDGTILNDRIIGDDSGVVLYGRSGNDFIYGGKGADFIIGGLGSDKLYGKGGNDRFSQEKDLSADTIDGGEGIDAVEYYHGSDENSILNGELSYSFDQAKMMEGHTEYTLVDSLSSSGSGSIVSTVLSNYKLGTTMGNKGFFMVDSAPAKSSQRVWFDTLSMEKSQQYVFSVWVAANSNVKLQLFIGDTLYSEYTPASGKSWKLWTYSFIAGGSQVANISIRSVGGSGNSWSSSKFALDDLKVSKLSYYIYADLSIGKAEKRSIVNQQVGVDELVGIEEIAGTAYADVILGDNEANRLFGEAGDDILMGRLGNDYLDGGLGRDSIEGGAGDDTLIGGGGSGGDTLIGGEGNDNFLVDIGMLGSILNGGTGTDWVIYNTQEFAKPEETGLEIDLMKGRTIKRLAGYSRSTNDVLLGIENVVGSNLSDKIIGDALNNVLSGELGNDSLFGGEGNDTLEGGAGSDVLQGEDGDDVLRGGYGADSIDGGIGNDLILQDIEYGFSDTIDGGDGIDTLSYAYTDLTLTTTPVYLRVDFDEATRIDTDYKLADAAGVAGTVALLSQTADRSLAYGGSGKSLVVSSAQDTKSVFWKRELSLSLGQPYAFSVYISSSYEVTLQLTINGVDVGAAFTASANAGWVECSQLFQSNANGISTIGLRVTSAAPKGGSFAIDAISLKAPVAGINVDLSGGTVKKFFRGLSDGTPVMTDRVTRVENVIGTLFNDRLKGDQNNNILDGGKGNDEYLYGRGGGDDVIVDNDKSLGNLDKLIFGEGITQQDLFFSHEGNDLHISILGRASSSASTFLRGSVTIKDWYLGAANHIERIQLADGSVLKNSSVEKLVSAMAVFKGAATTGQTQSTAILEAEKAKIEVLASTLFQKLGS